MTNNLQSISSGKAMRKSTAVLHPRVLVDTAPFTAQQRELIVTRFNYLHHGIPQIAARYGVGHKAIERVLRFEFWRAVGRRQSDRLMGKVAA